MAKHLERIKKARAAILIKDIEKAKLDTKIARKTEGSSSRSITGKANKAMLNSLAREASVSGGISSTDRLRTKTEIKKNRPTRTSGASNTKAAQAAIGTAKPSLLKSLIQSAKSLVKFSPAGIAFNIGVEELTANKRRIKVPKKDEFI